VDVHDARHRLAVIVDGLPRRWPHRPRRLVPELNADLIAWRAAERKLLACGACDLCKPLEASVDSLAHTIFGRSGACHVDSTVGVSL
jgi:hypothetical protein